MEQGKTNRAKIIDVVRDFLSWLQEVEQAGFEYVVAITRRESNLIALLDIQTGGLEHLGRTYITDNALLVKAEEIAKYYHEHRRFPKIAVIDDVLAHGRNLNHFMATFQQILFDCLKKPEVAFDQSKLENEFYRSITIWVFAINNAPFFLRQEYQWRLRYQNIWSESEWRVLSQKITDYIWSNPEGANTSYVPSVTVQDTEGCQTGVPHPDWIMDSSTRYRGGSQNFYLLQSACEYGIYPTVRTYVKGDEKQDIRYYTPYFFVDKLTPDQVVTALRKIFDDLLPLIPTSSGKLIRLFNTIGEQSLRLNVYCQLFYYILGQITLSVFWQDHYPAVPLPITGDWEKIAHNFGSSADIEPLFRELNTVAWTKEQLMSFVELLSEDKAPTLVQPLQPENRDEIISRLEISVYSQALEHEQQANALKHNITDFRLNEGQTGNTGEKTVFEFIRDIRCNDSLLYSNAATAAILSGLTQMMDRGDVALKARSDSDGTICFHSVVRNTEMSLSIMPRRLGKNYYSKFFWFAQFYWREENFPQRVESYFRDVIFCGGNGLAERRYVADAVKFAELIQGHRDIVGSMLNWRSIYGEEEEG